VHSSSQIITTNKPTPSFLQAGCPSSRPTNSVKALKENVTANVMSRTEYTGRVRYWQRNHQPRLPFASRRVSGFAVTENQLYYH